MHLKDFIAELGAGTEREKEAARTIQFLWLLAAPGVYRSATTIAEFLRNPECPASIQEIGVRFAINMLPEPQIGPGKALDEMTDDEVLAALANLKAVADGTLAPPTLDLFGGNVVSLSGRAQEYN